LKAGAPQGPAARQVDGRGRHRLHQHRHVEAVAQQQGEDEGRGEQVAVGVARAGGEQRPELDAEQQRAHRPERRLHAQDGLDVEAPSGGGEDDTAGDDDGQDARAERQLAAGGEAVAVAARRRAVLAGGGWWRRTVALHTCPRSRGHARCAPSSMHRQSSADLERARSAWFTRSGVQAGPGAVDVPEVAAPVPSSTRRHPSTEGGARAHRPGHRRPAGHRHPTPSPGPARRRAPATTGHGAVEHTTAADTDGYGASGDRRQPGPKPFFDPPLIAQRAVLGLPTGFLIADFARSQGIPYAAAAAAVDREMPRAD
jgi:hypothetical protein